MKKKHVAIVGAGFGGVAACRELSSCEQCQIEIIDRRNHHLFQPLLYQVAMAGLNPSEIAIPIRRLFSQDKNVVVTLAEVKDVDLEGTRLLVDGKWKQYDYIVLAAGAKHFYFGNDEWEKFAPGLKTIEQATEIRRRVLTAFEFAEKTEDPALQEKYLSFAVVGGGPTGIELAGAIAEMATHTLMKDYKLADLSRTKVLLVEGGGRILPAFPKESSRKAQEYLEEMGVEVRLNSQASNITAEGLEINGEFFACRTVLWAAGVKPTSLSEKVQTKKDRIGRLVVGKDLSLAENPKVFSVGDQVCFKEKEQSDPLPGVAPVALQQGRFVGKLIRSEIKGKKRRQFKYLDKGIMATIGRTKAVVSTQGLRINGFLAWLIWVFVHIVYLMRFKNRIFVFLQWIWSYFSFGRGARLIVQKRWRFYDGGDINYEKYGEDP